MVFRTTTTSGRCESKMQAIAFSSTTGFPHDIKCMYRHGCMDLFPIDLVEFTTFILHS